MNTATMLLDATTYALAGYFGVAGAGLVARTVRSGRALARVVDAPVRRASGPRFVVLLPMYREQTIVADAIAHYGELARTVGDVDVVVVTAGRERTTATTEPTTAELADRILAEGDHPCVRHVCAGTAIGKAAQMNFAVQWWSSEQGTQSPRTVYFACYDADSRPDRTAFLHVIDIVRGREESGEAVPPILQQVSCYLNNARRLRGLTGILALADGIAQSQWALGFEYPLYDRYSRAVREQRRRRLVYCVGHGCFIERRTLGRLGGFPTHTKTDDLSLGYHATSLGIEVLPIPALDYCDMMPSPLLSIPQSRFWFRGSASFSDDLVHYEAQDGIAIARDQRSWLVIDGTARNLAWAGRGIAFATLLAACFATGRTMPMLALLCAHVVFVHVGFLTTLWALTRRVPRPEGRRVWFEGVALHRFVAAFAVSSVVLVLRSLGPFVESLTLLSGTSPISREWKAPRA